MKLQPEGIELDEFCKELIESYILTGNITNKIEMKCSGLKRTVQMDKKLLRQILINLLNNAVKYSPGGEDILLKISYEDNSVIFEITDYGIGIPEEDQKRLFEPFHRAANIADIQGTGLGLSIVQKAVEVHKGKITFTSKENEGTTFKIILPVEQ